MRPGERRTVYIAHHTIHQINFHAFLLAYHYMRQICETYLAKIRLHCVFLSCLWWTIRVLFYSLCYWKRRGEKERGCISGIFHTVYSKCTELKSKLRAISKCVAKKGEKTKFKWILEIRQRFETNSIDIFSVTKPSRWMDEKGKIDFILLVWKISEKCFVIWVLSDCKTTARQSQLEPSVERGTHIEGEKSTNNNANRQQIITLMKNENQKRILNKRWCVLLFFSFDFVVLQFHGATAEQHQSK